MLDCYKLRSMTDYSVGSVNKCPFLLGLKQNINLSSLQLVNAWFV